MAVELTELELEEEEALHPHKQKGPPSKAAKSKRVAAKSGAAKTGVTKTGVTKSGAKHEAVVKPKVCYFYCFKD